MSLLSWDLPVSRQDVRGCANANPELVHGCVKSRIAEYVMKPCKDVCDMPGSVMASTASLDGIIFLPSLTRPVVAHGNSFL